MSNNNDSLRPGPRFQDGQPHTIKIAYFDVDNTLVANGKPDMPTDRFTAAAHSARGRMGLALATARPLSKTGDIIKRIDAKGFSILSNGAQIYDGEKQAIVAEWPMQVETSLQILEKLYASAVAYWINDDGIDYFPTSSPTDSSDSGKIEYAKQQDIWNKEGGLLPVPGYKPTKPFVIVAHNVAEDQVPGIHAITNNCDDPNVESIIAHEFAQPDGSFTYDMFILDKRANKKSALAVALEMQGLSANNVLAVGDGRNDAVLVATAAVGVAMGNSAAETLNVATFIAPDRLNDGAAVALEHFL